MNQGGSRGALPRLRGLQGGPNFAPSFRLREATSDEPGGFVGQAALRAVSPRRKTGGKNWRHREIFWQAAPENDPWQDFNYRNTLFRTPSVVDISAVIPGSRLLPSFPAGAFAICQICGVRDGTDESGSPPGLASETALQKVDDPWRCGRYSACYGLKCQQTFLVESCAAAAVIRSLVFFEMVTAAPARATRAFTRFVRK